MKKKTATELNKSLTGYPSRIPIYIKDWLAEIAAPERRSINDELILILERAYNAVNHKN